MMERKIYILFTDTGTIFTKIIKLYTRKTYNHVSIAFDNQLNEIYSFGRKQPYNPFIGGFVKEKMNEGLFEKSRCQVYSYTVSELEYTQMRNMVRQIEAEKDIYKYNLLGLFAIILNVNVNRTNAFFCSQFVATILNEKNGLLPKSPSLITPSDIMELKGLQLVYQGELNLYPQQYIENTMGKYLKLSFDI